MNKDSSVIDMARNKKRVFDQMSSMHFKLSDEYKRRASIEYGIEISIATLLCGVTFLNFQDFFNIAIERPTLVIGCISVFLLIFTIIKQRTGHGRLSEKHRLAGKMYTKSKQDISSKIAEWSIKPIPDDEILSYIDNHFIFLNDLPQIPEKHFTRLKHAHQEKVAMSKFLDMHQNDFWLICKLKFRFCINDNRRLAKDIGKKSDNLEN